MKSQRKWFETADAWVGRVEEFTLFALVALMLGMTFLQVILRLLPDNQSIEWVTLFSRTSVLWVGLIGASIAVARGKHITVDVLSRLLGTRGRVVMAAVNHLVGFGVLLVLFHGSLVYTLTKEWSEVLPNTWIPERVFTDPVPVLFLLMVWHQWVHWRREIASCRAWGPWLAAALGIALALVALLTFLADTAVFTPGASLQALDAFAKKVISGSPILFSVGFMVLAVLGAPLYVVISGIALVGHYGVADISVDNFIINGYGGFRKSAIFIAIPLF
ncbi:MAG: TRAP transporter small permease subunit, partial [Deltaproteobacteria bacterium]|nr:TRAP transporter small permease subunit [Deltaproteobacteria bacterium]